jgi:beta-glucosidase
VILEKSMESLAHRVIIVTSLILAFWFLAIGCGRGVDGGKIAVRSRTARAGGTAEQTAVLNVSSGRASDTASAKAKPKWQDATAPVEERVTDLVSSMTLEEKASQVYWRGAALPRLKIPRYHWWNEALHGVVRDEPTTLFPAPIALAATFDPDLMKQVATAIANEARGTAKYEGDIPAHRGLTLWSPTVNMARDPRWGRTAEGYGEDPWLSSRMTVAYVTGLQGDIPGRFKAAALLKHFPANNEDRARLYARHAVSERALRDYYFAPFEAGIREANSALILTGYDGNNDVPAACDPWLLKTVLRGEWGFTRATVTDVCTHTNLLDPKLHHWSRTAADACADQLSAGTDIIADDLPDGVLAAAIVEAIQKGLLKEADLDRAVKGMFDIRFRLGYFDPPKSDPYRKITHSVVACSAHRERARQAARESIVLLKNGPAASGKLLPLDVAKVKKIAVLGPFADRTDVGPYGSTPVGGKINRDAKGKFVFDSHAVGPVAGIINPIDGIRQRCGNRVEVLAPPSSLLAAKSADGGASQLAAELKAARKSEVVIATVGLWGATDESEGMDRETIEIPPAQTEWLKRVHEANPNVVCVVHVGSPLAMTWIAEHVPAMVLYWNPGQEGGHALADVLFGGYNPAGRLPITFYRSDDQLFPLYYYELFTDIRRGGRTYLYLNQKPLFPFGHGLSYTTFDYANLRLSRDKLAENDTLVVRVDVKNSGLMDGDEVVQVYVHNACSRYYQPIKQLRGFLRVHLKSGESRTVEIPVPVKNLRYWDVLKKSYVVDRGDYDVLVGASSADIRLTGRFSTL